MGLKTILVIEDEQTVSDVMSVILARAGYETLVASTAGQARREWAEAKDKIDVIICDQFLAGENGLRLVQEFQADRPNVRIVMCTGAVEGLNPSITYLLKPFSASQLLESVL